MNKAFCYFIPFLILHFSCHTDNTRSNKCHRNEVEISDHMLKQILNMYIQKAEDEKHEYIFQMWNLKNSAEKSSFLLKASTGISREEVREPYAFVVIDQVPVFLFDGWSMCRDFRTADYYWPLSNKHIRGLMGQGSGRLRMDDYPEWEVIYHYTTKKWSVDYYADDSVINCGDVNAEEDPFRPPAINAE